MSAVIFPFPIARRTRLIAKCVYRMLELRPYVAEKHLPNTDQDEQLDTLFEGAPLQDVHRQLRAFEAAARREVWRRVMSPGGAA